MSKRTCTVDECAAVVTARGLCHKHYERMRRTGSLVLSGRPGPKPQPPRTCSIDGCERRVQAHGLCGTHAQRVRRHGTVSLPPKQAAQRADRIVCRECSLPLPSSSFRVGRRVCIECLNGRNRAWRAANADLLRAKGAARWAANRERNLEKNRQYRIANREILRAKARMRDLASKRLRSANSNLTQQGLASRIAYYGGICWICRQAPYEHLDHVKPIAAGGPNLLANIRPACASCNFSKGAKWPFVPRQEVTA